MKKLLVVVVILAAIVGSGGAYYAYRRQPKPPEITKAAITRGNVVDSVGATGTLEAVTTVQVGTQVSGTVLELNADFNSIVRKGQVIARLDPSLLQTQIEQARANLVRSEADVERLKVSLDDSRTKLKRAEDLGKRNLIPLTELETAQVAVRMAEAQLRSSEAAVTQSRANLNQTEVNLEHTVIASPIDGIVIARNVDVGQTVAASLNAPTLFLLAADLMKMQVRANIDEADVGRMRPGQIVRFRVDAYPADDFEGQVSQVRLQPTVVQNVVTYITVINVPNPDLRLKPGMTANVTIEIARSDNVLRVPNAALRFRATADMFTALGLEVPAELQRTAVASATQTAGSQPAPANAAGGAQQGQRAASAPQASGGQGQASTSPSSAASANNRPTGAGQRGSGDRTEAQPGAPGAGEGTGGFGGTRGGPGGGRGGFGQMDPAQRQQMMERMQSMSPEERQQFLQQMRERGAAGGAGGTSQPANRVTPGQKPLAISSAQTIDSLFGPLPRRESQGRVWLYTNGQLKAVRVRLGISDGTVTELLSNELPEGTELVSGIVLGQARPATTGGPSVGGNPFMGGGSPRMPDRH